jgi:hypothetical protein
MFVFRKYGGFGEENVVFVSVTSWCSSAKNNKTKKKFVSLSIRKGRIPTEVPCPVTLLLIFFLQIACKNYE